MIYYTIINADFKNSKFSIHFAIHSIYVITIGFYYWFCSKNHFVKAIWKIMGNPFSKSFFKHFGIVLKLY